MILNNGNIKAVTDDKTGFTISIENPSDTYKTNWVCNKLSWGEAAGFSAVKTYAGENFVSVLYKRGSLSLEVKKSITEKCYLEEYILTNTGNTEYFLTKENFGIQFPYQCDYTDSENILDNTCISHIWCGGDICGIYSVKLRGNAPYLVMKTLEGAIDDYSINYNTAGINIGSFYRGAFVLHPKARIISPGESAKYTFSYEFSEEKPVRNGTPCFFAEKYTLEPGEKTAFTLKTENECEKINIYCGSEKIPFEKSGNRVSGVISFDKIGERKIVAQFDDKETFMYINVLPPISEVLKKRAEFIAEKQQYLKENSPLDGAYLVYDSQTSSLYYNHDEADHNSARERIGMGVFVCRQLQVHYDVKIMKSLIKHREFTERELFDEKSSFVFNDAEKDPQTRIYNFPWLSAYYLEWYALHGEKKCIKNAAEILLAFFELAEYKYSAQCIEAVRICEGLKKEGLYVLADELKEKFLKYVNMSATTTTIKNECSWVSEIPSCYVAYQSQAYILTGDAKYLEAAEKSLKMLEAFFAYQPDFRLNCIPVRYWDRYWFGKRKEYGDVFPHYWSALAGWALAWYDKATRSDKHKEIINANLSGNLCVFRENGFAHNNYLYPYKITMFSSDPDYKNDFLKPGVAYGKNYDAWANDQDWAFYFSSLFYKP